MTRVNVQLCIEYHVRTPRWYCRTSEADSKSGLLVATCSRGTSKLAYPRDKQRVGSLASVPWAVLGCNVLVSCPGQASCHAVAECGAMAAVSERPRRLPTASRLAELCYTEPRHCLSASHMSTATNSTVNHPLALRPAASCLRRLVCFPAWIRPSSGTQCIR